MHDNPVDSERDVLQEERRQLGIQLRSARVAAGLSIEGAAVTLECSAARLRRIERGSVRITNNELRLLLARYGLGDSQLSSSVVSITLPVTIFLSDGSMHERVEASVEDLLGAVGARIERREAPVIGSWFRRMWARTRVAASSQLAMETAATAAHAIDSRLVLAQDAAVTAMMLQNLGPVIAALESTKHAVIRVGALLIVKVDGRLGVHQLTARQQLELDHQPHLALSPHAILAALELDHSGQTATTGHPLIRTKP